LDKFQNDILIKNIRYIYNLNLINIVCTMKKLLLLVNMLIVGFIVMSCNDRDNDLKKKENNSKNSSKNSIVVKNFRAEVLPPRDPNTPPGPPPPAPNKFTLYSLRENKPVDFSKFDTDEWDIGFRTTTIIVNGGKARKGLGGVFIQDGVFDDIKSAPEDSSKFAGDESDKEFAIKTGSGKGWYIYTGVNPPYNRHNVLPIPGKILILKTGNGKKYAKIEILSYYKDSPKDLDLEPAEDITSFYTFRYSLFE